jgi:hypothetical protein
VRFNFAVAPKLDSRKKERKKERKEFDEVDLDLLSV